MTLTEAQNVPSSLNHLTLLYVGPTHQFSLLVFSSFLFSLFSSPPQLHSQGEGGERLEGEPAPASSCGKPPCRRPSLPGSSRHSSIGGLAAFLPSCMPAVPPLPAGAAASSLLPHAYRHRRLFPLSTCLRRRRCCFRPPCAGGATSSLQHGSLLPSPTPTPPHPTVRSFTTPALPPPSKRLGAAAPFLRDLTQARNPPSVSHRRRSFPSLACAGLDRLHTLPAAATPASSSGHRCGSPPRASCRHHPLPPLRHQAPVPQLASRRERDTYVDRVWDGYGFLKDILAL